MKSNKALVSIAVFIAIFSSTVNAATLASDVSLADGGDVETAINQLSGAVAGIGSDITRIDTINTQQTNAITHNASDLNGLKDVAIIHDQSINKNTADIASLQTDKVDTTTFDIYQNSQNDKDTSQDMAIGAAQSTADIANNKAEANTTRITTLENEPKPKDGVNGKDGITTTITKVDTVSQAKIASQSNQIATLKTQTTAQAHDLNAAKQVFEQAQASSNTQFRSLKDEVDSNKKEARSGVASAVAIASMPQVEKSQAVMFSAGIGSFKDEQALSVGASFHAGEHAIIKAGISDSTNNDLAMGAGIGIGF
ncbi:YadA C-terminal domain-containing protein [Scandinavium sp. M-37]|uniref:YadA C-terminal domain-containing protein n=1 Tax=Scandinavium sp. M-37 TaxID=3373077 RepID=UPI0037453F0A